MKRILVTTIVIALAAGGYFFLTHKGGQPGTAGTSAAKPGGEAAAPPINSQLSTINPAARRPMVEPYVDKPLPPPTHPPAGWSAPKFAEVKGKLVRQTPVAQVPGDMAVARVEVGGDTHEMFPNQVGHFDRVPVARNGKTAFAIGYPQARAGETVIAVAEDTGKMGKDSAVSTVVLDEKRVAAFEFETAGRKGLYRVSLKKGADLKVMEFWAGPEPGFVNAKTTPPQ